MQTAHTSKQRQREHRKMYYPIKSFFNDESDAYRHKNYRMWNQIQPEIQSIANHVITEMELVKLAIQEIRENDSYSDVYQKRISDAIYAIFSVGKNRFQDWLDQCDKELAFEYSGELFCVEIETNSYGWVSFSKFLDHDRLEGYFNACLLLYAMEITTINNKNTQIIRSVYGHIPAFRAALQDKFQIMDNYHTFQHRWKGGDYYTKQLFV